MRVAAHSDAVLVVDVAASPAHQAENQAGWMRAARHTAANQMPGADGARPQPVACLCEPFTSSWPKMGGQRDWTSRRKRLGCCATSWMRYMSFKEYWTISLPSPVWAARDLLGGGENDDGVCRATTGSARFPPPSAHTGHGDVQVGHRVGVDVEDVHRLVLLVPACPDAAQNEVSGVLVTRAGATWAGKGQSTQDGPPSSVVTTLTMPAMLITSPGRQLSTRWAAISTSIVRGIRPVSVLSSVASSCSLCSSGFVQMRS